MSVANLMLHVT